MSLRWNGVVQRKLALMDGHLVQLERHMQDVSSERFVEDWVLRTIGPGRGRTVLTA